MKSSYKYAIMDFQKLKSTLFLTTSAHNAQTRLWSLGLRPKSISDDINAFAEQHTLDFDGRKSYRQLHFCKSAVEIFRHNVDIVIDSNLVVPWLGFSLCCFIQCVSSFLLRLILWNYAIGPSARNQIYCRLGKLAYKYTKRYQWVDSDVIFHERWNYYRLIWLQHERDEASL